MNFLRPRTGVLVAAAALLLAMPAASADQDWHAVVTGSGTVSPGVGLEPTFLDSVSFTVTLALGVGTSGDTIVATNCTFTGKSSIPETILEGKGSGTLGGCIGTNVAGALSYERTLGTLTISGSITINGSAHIITNGTFQIVPTSAPPVTTYQMAGELSLA